MRWNMEQGELAGEARRRAALSEPALLIDARHNRRVHGGPGHEVTSAVAQADDRKARSSKSFARHSLLLERGRSCLAGGWQALMEKWAKFPDSDVRWIMKENLKKKRLTPDWMQIGLQAWQTRLNQ